MGSIPKLEHVEGSILTHDETILLRRLLATHETQTNLPPPKREDPLSVPQRSPTGNPSALGIAVFAVANTLIGLHLMQVRGIQHDNLLVGILWFTGGVASWLACVLEYMQGNTFAYTVFGSFGGYYFAFASTMTPAFQIEAGYQDAAEYQNSLGTFFAIWASLFTIFFIASLRTNLVFVWIFTLVVATAWCLAASYFRNAAGDLETGMRLSKAAGGLLFSSSMGGWYMVLVQLLEAVAMPFSLPLGTLNKEK